MYTFRPTLFQQILYPSFQWNKTREEKILYLTFDDGPTPEVTNWVLSLLEQYKAKGTFFVKGENVEAYPDLFQKLLKSGHSIGNHTFSHPNGWKTDLKNYLQDIEKCNFALRNHGCDTDLFRPPYGRIKFSQAKELRQYDIVMWSLLSGDFDEKLNLGASLKKLITAKNGDILLFHDTTKAERNLKHLLPVVLDYYSQRGYQFESL